MIRPATPEAIAEAASILREGGLVGMPTETVYGLAADALSPSAAAGIFAAKGRPSFDPLIVHCADAEAAFALAAEIPEAARQLARLFWPGPLTLILKRRDIVPDIVTSGLPSVGLRVPEHPVALALLKACGRPLAAPSANPFGYLSPTCAQHVEEQLGDRIAMVLDGGPCQRGVESTILDLSRGAPELLRPGALALEEIEKVIGPVKRGQAVLDIPLAPGQLLSHYAPKTPLSFLAPGAAPVPRPGLRCGLLAFRAPPQACAFEAVEVLSGSGSLDEAATCLFAALHRLDDEGLDLILAESFPENGLGLAIMDRLRKAARKRPEF
ncbi:MAG: Threonylcarbamoyl-AMP synthase [Verrucomicrobiota bacterium]|jgi:L-threonylcarbamoyladenylate synthase